MKNKLRVGLRVVMSVYFGLNGILKLASHPHMVESFEGWGYSRGFLLLIGAVELAAALALLGPRSALLAAVVLEGVMVGALGTHLRHGEWTHALIPLAVMPLLGLVAWAHRPGASRGARAVP